MVKGGIPVCRRVALGAVGRHLRRFVIGISRAVVVGNVTIDTLARGSLELAAYVALLTRCLNMRSR